MPLLKIVCESDTLTTYLWNAFKFSSLSHYSLHVCSFRKNTITKHALRHPYRTCSKTRVMGEVEKVQEHMKADMVALKDQKASMMEAM